MRATRTQINFESLDRRILLSGSTTASRIVYVSSSSGSDSNSGLSSSSPVKSFAKAKSLIRDGKPDQMLLKAGDVFTSGIGPWKTSGPSASQKQVIGSYGSGARPLIKSGTSEGFVTFG